MKLRVSEIKSGWSNILPSPVSYSKSEIFCQYTKNIKIGFWNSSLAWHAMQKAYAYAEWKTLSQPFSKNSSLPKEIGLKTLYENWLGKESYNHSKISNNEKNWIICFSFYFVVL